MTTPTKRNPPRNLCMFSVLGSPAPRTPHPHDSKVPTVTGIEPLGVAILVTVVVFYDASKPPSS